MNFLKNFFSHVLAIIFFCAVLVLGVTTAVKELITHENVYTAIEKTNYWEQIEKEEGRGINTSISK